MFRHPVFATVVVSVCMLLYQVLLYLEWAKTFTAVLLLISPFLILWMLLSILKDKQHKVVELKEEEEWGYSDKDKDALGMF